MSTRDDAVWAAMNEVSHDFDGGQDRETLDTFYARLAFEGFAVVPVVITYDVIAYDEGGYGDNRSKTFPDQCQADAYAQSLPANFGAKVYKRISYPTASQEPQP